MHPLNKFYAKKLENGLIAGIKSEKRDVIDFLREHLSFTKQLVKEQRFQKNQKLLVVIMVLVAHYLTLQK
jgi:hypothetical protein